MFMPTPSTVSVYDYDAHHHHNRRHVGYEAAAGRQVLFYQPQQQYHHQAPVRGPRLGAGAHGDGARAPGAVVGDVVIEIEAGPALLLLLQLLQL